MKKCEARQRNPRAPAPRRATAWDTRGVRSPRRPLGSTGLHIAPLGLGGGPLGDLGISDADAARVIDAALDAGVDLIDTAPSYGASEDRLGQALRGRRDQVVLVTKGGYGVPGVPDWSPAVIARGVDQALARLATDHLDVFLLHSCDRARLEVGDLLEPLVAARAAGKVRAIGYAGDGDALAWAVRCPALDVVECSVNLVDQRALADAIRPRSPPARACSPSAAWPARRGCRRRRIATISSGTGSAGSRCTRPTRRRPTTPRPWRCGSPPSRRA